MRPEDIAPVKLLRVMDLVEQAGHDVRDWSNFTRGPEHAASNPRYCYEWSYLQEDTSAIANIWHAEIKNDDQSIYFRDNLRTIAKRVSGSQIKRAKRMDEHIHIAAERGLPVRVILLGRTFRDGRRITTARELDNEAWAVTKYDHITGDFILRRALEPARLSLDDQDIETSAIEGEIIYRMSTHRKRERSKRQEKLEDFKRKNGGRVFCEIANCGFDFNTRYGDIGNGYAHVHHLSPLSEAPITGIHTQLSDLAVVCANCHDMIHRGGECRSLAEIEALLRTT
jgi:5-methylcytosine-specific restriction protein A